jgi:peptidyl-prolyl cis-trans isomerase C
MIKQLISALLLTALLSPLPATADDDADTQKTLVTVNGIAITEAELAHFMGQQKEPVTPQRALAEMINVELLVQAARDEDLLKDEELVLGLRRNRNSLIASHYLQKHLAKLEVDDAQLRQRYDEIVNADRGNEYNANHILVETEQRARELIDELVKGASFTELAKAHSTGPSGASGGALGWFRIDEMVAPFAQAAKALKPGSFSRDPVQTEFGWHIILLNNVRPIEPPAFEAVRDQLGTQFAADSISKKIKALHDKSVIEFNSAE